MSRLFLLVLLSTVPCHSAEKSQPCATPFAVIQFDENGTNIGGLGPEDLKWFNSKEQKKYPCLRLQESVTEHTQFGLVIGISRSDSS